VRDTGVKFLSPTCEDLNITVRKLVCASSSFPRCHNSLVDYENYYDDGYRKDMTPLRWHCEEPEHGMYSAVVGS